MKLLGITLFASLALFSPAPVNAQVNGVIYSTNAQGVGQNLFNSKSHVYLAGGSGPLCSGNGLADGLHYFQVTNPSGSVLLSTDSLASRQVLVSNGVIVGAAPGRSIKNGPCGSKIVQVANFLTSPNGGGEYKVWLTSVSDYIPGAGSHGFVSSKSKTDNFKVREGGPLIQQTSIRGAVFYDLDEDGLFDPLGSDMPLSGWRVEITGEGVTDYTFTDQDGLFEFLRPATGEVHRVESIAPEPGFVGTLGGRWLPTTPIEVHVTASGSVVEVGFGNLFLINTPEFARSKGYWHNQGQAELAACDPLWRETINSLCLRTNFTNATGEEGTLFTVSMTDPFATVFQQLSSYLTAPAYGVLANILSVQFAAANLNRSCGPLAGVTTYVDRLGDGVLVSLEALVVETQALLCNPRSANTGPGGDEEWRQMIMMCLNEWSDLSSDGDSIYTKRPASPFYLSPY
jgi:hypothetical protein